MKQTLFLGHEPLTVCIQNNGMKKEKTKFFERYDKKYYFLPWSCKQNMTQIGQSQV